MTTTTLRDLLVARLRANPNTRVSLVVEHEDWCGSLVAAHRDCTCEPRMALQTEPIRKAGA